MSSPLVAWSGLLRLISFVTWSTPIFDTDVRSHHSLAFVSSQGTREPSELVLGKLAVGIVTSVIAMLGVCATVVYDISTRPLRGTSSDSASRI